MYFCQNISFMSNPIVAHFKQNLNQPYKRYPSYLTEWLQPILLEVEEGYSLFKITVRQDMLNPIKTLHGGISAAILDDLVGFTVYSLNDSNYYTTLNNYIDYLGAARLDDVILIESKVAKRGKQFVNVECTIWDESKSKMIAKGVSNLFRLNQEREK